MKTRNKLSVLYFEFLYLLLIQTKLALDYIIITITNKKYNRDSNCIKQITILNIITCYLHCNRSNSTNL